MSEWILKILCWLRIIDSYEITYLGDKPRHYIDPIHSEETKEDN